MYVEKSFCEKNVDIGISSIFLLKSNPRRITQMSELQGTGFKICHQKSDRLNLQISFKSLIYIMSLQARKFVKYCSNNQVVIKVCSFKVKQKNLDSLT